MGSETLAEGSNSGSRVSRSASARSRAPPWRWTILDVHRGRGEGDAKTKALPHRAPGDRRTCANSWILLLYGVRSLGVRDLMAKPNYQHARKQRELARKSRQQEKQQRRSSRAAGVADAGSEADSLADAAGTPGAPVTGRG
jgi:hypothetical protein